MKYNYILASASPRRKELLSRYIASFKVIPPEVDETLGLAMPLEDELVMLSERKAQSVAKKAHDNGIVIAADTIVAKDGRVYGKPSSKDEAYTFLNELNGEWHEVLTAVSVYFFGKVQSFVEKTRVKFNNNPYKVLKWYVNSGDALDKAGAYGIQGVGALLVEKIEGDYNNVVGLPLSKLMNFLIINNLYDEIGG